MTAAGPPSPPPQPADATGVLDVVVVGGGPAGLSAALVLGRSRRRVVVLDDGTPRNAAAGHVQGYLGHDGTPPAELLALGRAEVERYGVGVVPGRAVRLVPATPTPDAPGRAVQTVTLADGTEVRARRVIVTTGLHDELPAVPGVAERWGRDVLHCPYCHGWEAQDAAMVVVASRHDEVDKAVTMTLWSPDVTLVVQGEISPADLAAAQRDRLAAVGVRVEAGPVSDLLLDEDRITGVRLADGTEIACSTLVVQPRVVARDDLLTQAGAEVAAGPFGEFVVTDETGATGIPGVWAAGNVAEPGAQVVVAAAAGYRAALAVDHDLLAEDVDLAVRARAGSITHAAAEVAATLNVKYLVTFTQSGDSARRVSRLRSHIPMLAFTPTPDVRSTLALTWGVQTYEVPMVTHTDAMVVQVDQTLRAHGLAEDGDLVVIVFGAPVGVPGTTNSLLVHKIGTEIDAGSH